MRWVRHALYRYGTHNVGNILDYRLVEKERNKLTNSHILLQSCLVVVIIRMRLRIFELRECDYEETVNNGSLGSIYAA